MYSFVRYEAAGRCYASADLSFDLAYWAAHGLEEIKRLSEPTSIGHLFERAKEERQTMPTVVDVARCENAQALARRVPKGRILFAEELRRIIRSERWRDAVQYVYLRGEARLFPGVDLSKRLCHRCGQSTGIVPTECATCRTTCAYCQRCLQMGRSKACAPLYAISAETDDRPSIGANPLRWTGELTEAQREASLRAIEAAKGIDQRLLVWAVCGAGKTEVVFGPIGAALERGKKVMIATPRKDVVLELTPRLKRAFPDISVIAIYGESKEKWEEAEIVVSTTHQALRFYKKFDLVILDEVDAFPYHGDPMLYYAVERAKKRTGNLIYLSATPPVSLRSSVPHTLIPARYHRKPLAVPKIVIDKKCDRRIPAYLKKAIDFLRKERRQAFLFVPYIERAETLADQLRRLNPYVVVEGVHASDPSRDRKVAAFRNGDIDLLVTTTIMERGVTVPRADVIALQADAPIFDEAALVQISGRTGRSIDDPVGHVTFIAKEKTRAMVKAKRHIQAMNKLAKKKGLLDG